MSARRAVLTALAALVLGVGLLVGLGAGSASAGHADTTLTTTTATVSEPVVTTVVETTSVTQTLPGAGKPIVRLGYANTQEQAIIGKLYELALEHQGYRVTPYHDDGAPHARAVALQDRTLDVYPEYLGEWNSRVARLHRRFKSMRASYAAADTFARGHGYVLLPPTPFSDTSCVAVLSQYAQENHVYSIPELVRGQPVIFGAPTLFQDEADGLPALRQSYHLDPDYVQPILVVGLQYWWLRTGNVDAAYCATTDPALAGPKYLQLQDPKHIFGYGNVIPVTTNAVIDAEGQQFVQTIKQVDALLTLPAIRGLNAELELGGHTAAQVAEQFLEGNGLLPPSRYAPVTTATATSTAAAT